MALGQGSLNSDVAITLLEISIAINERLELTGILEQIVKHTQSLVHCDDASIILWNAERNRFENGASTNYGSDIVQYVRHDDGVTRWIVDHGTSRVVPDAAYDEPDSNEIVAANQIRAYAGLPVQYNETTLGVLYALSRQSRVFNENEMAILQALAEMGGIAIHNARVFQALREASDFKNNMLRLAAHDLRGPLGLIVGYFELLVDEVGPLSQEHSEWVKAIRNGLTRVDDLINGLLDYDRLASGEEIKHESCDLKQIALEAVSELEMSAAQKSQTLRLETSNQTLTVTGDPLLLHQSIYNLVSNAIKYTHQGGEIVVTVTAESEEIVICVSDTGTGIDPEDLKNLFQPFTRLKSGSGEHGRGLGLSLVKVIAERHGGHVGVTSVVGQGSQFYIYLPYT